MHILKKVLKFTGITFGVFFLVLLVILTTVYFLLKSPGVIEKGFAQIQPDLKENGLDMSFEEASIDLLGGIRLKNLKLIVDQPPGTQGTINLQNFEVLYSLGGILGKKIVIHKIAIQGIDVDMVVASEEVQEEETVEEKEAGEPFDLAGFINDPPVELDLKQLVIDDTQINFAMATPATTMNIELPSLSVNASFQLLKGLLRLKQDFQLANQVENSWLNVKLQAGDPANQSDIQLATALRQNVLFEIKQAEGGQGLGMFIEPVGIQFALRNLSLVAKAEETQQTSNISIPTIDFASELRMGSGVFDATVPDPVASLLPLKIQSSQKLAIPSIKIKSTAPGQTMELTTEAGMNNDMDLTIQSLTDLSQNLIEIMETELKVAHLNLNQKVDKQLPVRIALDEQIVAINGSKKDRYEILIDLISKGLDFNQVLKKKTRIELNNKISITPDFRNFEIIQAVALNGDNLVNLAHNIQDQENALSSKQTIDFKAGYNLMNHLKNLDILSQVGGWKGKIDLDTTLKHGASSILAANFDDPDTLQIHNSFKILLDQFKKPTAKNKLVQLLKPLTMEGDFGLENHAPKVDLTIVGEQLQALQFKIKALKLALGFDQLDEWNRVKLDTQIAQLLVPQLGQRIDTGVKLDLEAHMEQADVKAKLGVQVHDLDVLNLTLDVDDKKNLLTVLTGLDVDASPRLRDSIAKLKPLEMLGHMKVKLEHKLVMEHLADTIKTFDPETLPQSKINSNLVLTADQIQSPSRSLEQRIILHKPVVINHVADVFNNALESNLSLNVPKVILTPSLDLSDIGADVVTNIPDFNKPDFIDTVVSGKVGQVKTINQDKDALKIEQLVNNVLYEIKLEVFDQKRIELKHLAMRVGDLMKLGATGKVDGESQDGYLRGFVKVNAPKKLPEPMVGGGSGSLKIPWNVSIEGGKQFALNGQLEFKDFNLEMAEPKINLKNLRGVASFSEELGLTADGGMKFNYLLEQNPFERVDFSRQQNLINTDPLYFENMTFNNINIGPLRAIVAIEQNMVNLHKFDVDLLDGSASGELAVDVLPKQLSVRLLSRVTNIRPKLLGTGTSEEENQPISLRTALLFDVNRSLMNGRIDVNQIGGNQLISLINVIDPKYEDDQMNSARSALNLAYPTYVGMNMDQGMMDMDIDIVTAGVPSSVSVRKVPLYAFVASATEDLVLNLKEVPIQ